MNRKKRKKYKRITLQQARVLWEAGADCERRWNDEQKYESVAKIWGAYGHKGNVAFYSFPDGMSFRVEVE